MITHSQCQQALLSCRPLRLKAIQHQRQPNVFGDRQRRDQVEKLKDITDVTPTVHRRLRGGQRMYRNGGTADWCHIDPPAIRGEQARQQVQQTGLANATRTTHRHDRASRRGKRKLMQDHSVL